jgi:membrane protein
VSADLRRALTAFREEELTDRAAALTYYGLLSLFPALIALVSLVGLVGDARSTTRSVVEAIEEIGPDSAADTFRGPVESIASSRGTAGAAFVLGLAVATWSASGYVGAFGRASHAIYDRTDERPVWKQRPQQLLVTLAMLILAALLSLGLVLSGPVVEAIAGPAGIGSTAVALWDLLKLPVLAGIFVAMIGLLYSTSLEPTFRGVRWFSLGGLAALLVWALASAAFAAYLGNFGSYDATYGTLAGMVALLVWLWITNVAILFGHVLNAQRDPSRAAAGEPRRDPRPG